MDVGNSVPPVSISGERNALSRRQEVDSITCIRRRRAATQSDDDPEKRANDTNELSATVDTKSAVPSFLPTCWLFSSSVCRDSFSSQTDPRLDSLPSSDYATHLKLVLAEFQVSAQMCITNVFTTRWIQLRTHAFSKLVFPKRSRACGTGHRLRLPL